MADEPEIPETWKKPPDPEWRPSQEKSGCGLAMGFVGILFLLAFGTCLLTVR